MQKKHYFCTYDEWDKAMAEAEAYAEPETHTWLPVNYLLSLETTQNANTSLSPYESEPLKTLLFVAYLVEHNRKTDLTDEQIVRQTAMDAWVNDHLVLYDEGDEAWIQETLGDEIYQEFLAFQSTH